jgi:hypothetical protein
MKSLTDETKQRIETIKYSKHMAKHALELTENLAVALATDDGEDSKRVSTYRSTCSSDFILFLIRLRSVKKFIRNICRGECYLRNNISFLKRSSLKL